MSENMRYLTFALGKGRLANKTLELLEQIGITCEEMKDKNSRKLIFVNEELKLKFFLAKGPDVPTYVEYEQLILVLLEKIRLWKRTVKYTRFLILVLENAVCVSADLQVPESFCNIMK